MRFNKNEREKLRTLFLEMEYESSRPARECDTDKMVECEHSILNMIRKEIFPEEFHYMNDYTGELRKNLWDVISYLTWYFFFCIRKGYKNPIMPGKWKYNKKGW